jgi:hypothetical protein
MQTQDVTTTYTHVKRACDKAQEVSDVHGHVIAVLHMSSCQSQEHASIAWQIGSDPNFNHNKNNKRAIHTLTCVAESR